MRAEIRRSVRIEPTPRVLQLSGMFDVPRANTSELAWSVDLPIEERPWQIGAIVGPSGSGKSTIARELFGPAVVEAFDWPTDRSVLDGFPEALSIKEVTTLLSSVGFSSPPNWLRPFGVLSTGEKFRATVARALAENAGLVVIDEFTSVVDRTVAQIGSAAVAKRVRATGRQFVAVTCHYDVLDWLQPDWVYEPASNRFAWRSLQQRPAIELEIVRASSKDWPMFKAHHYLTHDIAKSARCFVATLHGRPVAFGSVVYRPQPSVSFWGEHRFVVLPDYQGVGIGNRLSEYVASLFKASGRPYRGVTNHPAYVQHRLRSALWRCRKRGALHSHPGRKGNRLPNARLSQASSTTRITWSFEYVGPSNRDAARAFGILR